MATHPANSAALESVADRKTIFTLGGKKMMLSSHTTPLSLSFM